MKTFWLEGLQYFLWGKINTWSSVSHWNRVPYSSSRNETHQHCCCQIQLQDKHFTVVYCALSCNVHNDQIQTPWVWSVSKCLWVWIHPSDSPYTPLWQKESVIPIIGWSDDAWREDAHLNTWKHQPLMIDGSKCARLKERACWNTFEV